MRNHIFSRKAVSLLMSVLMVITMIPTFVFSVVAEEAEATLPAQVSGEWEHKLVPEGVDYAGWGEYYVSMWAKNTEFVFMQTKEDETFRFSFEFWAMKNDGVNSATIKSTSVRGMDFTNAYWTSLTPSLAGDTPDGTGLPGSLGSGHSNQLNNNLVKWQYTGEFTCNAPDTRTAKLNVEYKSGSTSTNTKTHTLAGNGEEVVINITIVNLRELLARLEAAEFAYENDDQFTDEEKAELKTVIDNINNNYTLDGTVAYTQEEIDSLCADIEEVVGADLDAYRQAVAKAERFVNSDHYSDESKAPVLELLAQKDTVLSMTVHQQDQIDDATDALNEAVTNAIIASSVSMNGINPYNPSTTATFTFNSSKDGDENYDAVAIDLNYSDIYMDISERLSDMGLTYNMSTYFANEFGGAAPVTNSLATESNIAGEANKFNFGDYFAYTTTSSSEEQFDTGRSDHTWQINHLYTIDGETPLKTTADEGEKVYVGAYWYQKKNDWWSPYNYKSYDGDIFSIDNDQPYFTLHVYDKSALGTVLNETIWVTDNGAVNFDDFESVLNAAKNVYGTRVTTQADIDAAVNAIQNFVFEYTVNTAVGVGEGTVNKTLVSGEELANGNYTCDSVVTVTAVPGDDYIFVSWNNGNKNISFNYTVKECVEFTANFVFVPANTENLENAIDDVSEIDTSKYSEESVAALEEAIAAAQKLINSNLGKSRQDDIDAAELLILNAADNLEKVVFEPCDYSVLDQAISQANDILTDLPVNDGRYKDEAWQNFLDALNAANSVDRNLTDENEDNQSMIDEKALDLAEAVSALNETENQNYLIVVKDENDNVCATIPVNKASDTTFGDIKSELSEMTPPADERYEFLGWADGDGNILTDDTVITGDMTVKPIYEILTFIPTEGATVNVETDGETVYVGTELYYNAVENLTSQFVLNGTEYIVCRNGVELSEEMTVRTGDKIQCIDVNTNEVLAEAIVVLYGDVNGDGAVDTFDAIKIDLYNNSVDVDMSGAYGKAADMNADGTIGTNDYSIVSEYVICNGDIHRNNGN